MFCKIAWLSDWVPAMERSDPLPPALPTSVPNRDQAYRLLDHRFDHLTYRLEVLILRSSELVHTEVISRQGVFLRRLARVQTARSLVDHELLPSRSAERSLWISLAYLDPTPTEDGAYVARLLLEETGDLSLALPLPRLEEVRRQVYQTFVAGR